MADSADIRNFSIERLPSVEAIRPKQYYSQSAFSKIVLPDGVRLDRAVKDNRLDFVVHGTCFLREGQAVLDFVGRRYPEHYPHLAGRKEPKAAKSPGRRTANGGATQSRKDILDILDAAMLDFERGLQAIDKVAIHVMIKEFRNAETGLCFPSVETLARLLHVSRATMFRILNRLSAAGYVSWTQQFSKGKQETNLYSFTLPGAAVSESHQRYPETPSPSLTNEALRVSKNAVSESHRCDTEPRLREPRLKEPRNAIDSQSLSSSSFHSDEDSHMSGTGKPALQPGEVPEPKPKAVEETGIFRDGFNRPEIGFVSPKECRRLRGQYPHVDIASMLAHIDREIAEFRFPYPFQKTDFKRRFQFEFEQADRRGRHGRNVNSSDGSPKTTVH